MADEVVIISYRTDPGELLSVVNNELCYASNKGTPVYLGVETNRLPVEEHLLIRRDEAIMAIKNKDLLIDVSHNRLPYFKRYTVMPERLS